MNLLERIHGLCISITFQSGFTLKGGYILFNRYYDAFLKNYELHATKKGWKPPLLGKLPEVSASRFYL
jgi:hypothetical protein